MDLRPGDIVFGETESDKYEVTRLIDVGGFGIVYEVKNEQGDVFALKTITTAFLSDAGLQALINEGRLATEIHHENVLRVFHFHDGQKFPQLPPYMLMEYADGGTLKGLLDGRRSTNQYFDSNELQDIFVQLASGMQAVSEKLVHRDIKPDNILIVKGRPKISDFGLSKVVGAATRSQSFKGINHVMYCAPEAWRLDKNLPSMDMYSMGITFYEVATLRHPYVIDEERNAIEAWKNAHFSKLPISPEEHNDKLDSKLAQIIMKMMSKRPEDRYGSWKDVIQRLQASDLDERPQRNVSSLVARAVATQRDTEKARIEAEAKRNLRQEQSDLLSVCFSEVIEAARETVEAFNNQSEFLKLRLQTSADRFSIYADKGGGELPTVSAKVVLAEDVQLRNNQFVKGWGLVRSPSKRGFNLLLIAQGKDDLYGRWNTLHVTHSAIAVRRDSRPEPFPFEIGELPKEIHLLNAMHIYETTRGLFRAEMLDPLIEELLQVDN